MRNPIDEGLQHKENQWEAKYPLLRDPYGLPDNEKAALGTLQSTEKRLSDKT